MILIANINSSVFFVAIVMFIILAGILIVEYYKRSISNKEVTYFLILLAVLTGHILFDTFAHLNFNYFVFKLHIFMDLGIILFFLFMIYLLGKQLKKFWKYLVLFFIIIDVIIDISAEFYNRIEFLKFFHFVLMIGVSVSLYFLIITFLVDTTAKKINNENEWF